MNDSVISQLHRTLVDAIRRSRPGALDRPVTVAEIYQDLLPYRAARSEVGFEMNADYEHALLRLLAGEGDYARIEPREVRDKLRMELDSPNPNVGVFRNYAACDVFVNIDAVDADGVSSWEEEFLGDDEDELDDDEEVEEILDLSEDSRGPVFEIAAQPEAVAESEPTEEIEHAREEPASQSDACAFCGADLPLDRLVNFCPFCGTDQSQMPCPSCGELLDPLWRFCVSCGTRVRPLGDHVN